MKRNLIFLLSFLLLGSLMLAIALFIPSSLPAHSDFSALYNTDLALVNGVPIYDLKAVEAIAIKASDLPPENFFLARFPYPPWYALSTFYLGLLPAKAAATLWFELNLMMLLLSVWLLTDGWSSRLRLMAFPLALSFLPVLGALSVGQYDFPVLLGTSLLIYSLRKENIALTTLGAVLLTFKPHIGALILLSALIYLIGNRSRLAPSSIDGFERRGLRFILIAGAFLFIIGFVADPAWPFSYPKMLLNYQGEGNVSSCSECASLSVWLSRWFFDGSFSKAMIISIVLLVVLAGIFFMRRAVLVKSPGLLLTSALSITLLSSPYLYNYDFLLLLVPFAVLINIKSSLFQKIVVLLCYLIPIFAIAFFGRDGNISLLLVTVLITILLYSKPKVDVPALTS